MRHSIQAASLLAVLAATFPSHADEKSALQVQLAKNDITDSMSKLAVLTDSLTTEGKKNVKLAALELTNALTSGIDSAIAAGLKNDMTCSEINSQVPMYYNRFMDGDIGKNIQGKAAKNAYEELKKNIHSYTAAQCHHLTE